jgi:hypothetical protein
MTNRFNPKWIIGRTIVAVDMKPFSDGRGGTVHDPAFTLDNGAKVSFITEETYDRDYGVNILYLPPPK